MADTLDLESGTEEESPLFIVGVGASAGGLEALEQLFRHTAENGRTAYVVVQHLSPDFESLMDKLLGRTTTLPIHTIEDGMEIEPNAIYLLPPKKEVILSGNRLLLAEKTPGRELSFPIDNFFRSLAQNSKRHGIAVVLSGTGSDGSRGVREVHEAGGFVIVQSESSAKFDGMPRNACDTGIVDAVLAPHEIPEAIVRYIESPLVGEGVSGSGMHGRGDGPIFIILSLLKKRYDIDFGHYKIATISRRIERRLMLSGLENVSQYAARLRSHPEELDTLYKDLLIGVTGFFRDREVFERLELDVIPALLEKARDAGEMRAWVVGTATGEEAYSLAILLHEANERLENPVRIKLFASDVHHESLEYASRGIYQAESLSGLTADRRDRYFEEKIDGYHASPDLRKMVVFVPHNAITNAPFTNLDLITCRNVFIYFSPDTQKKVLSLFHFGLKTGGVLCLGSSETLGELSNEFEGIDERCRIFRKHRDVSLHPSMRMPLGQINMLNPITSPPVRTAPEGSTKDLLDTYDRLLATYIPTSVLIDSEGVVQHTFGDASRYMVVPPGRPTKNLLEMTEPRCKDAVAAVIRRATMDPDVTASTRVQLEEGGEAPYLRVTAKHVDSSNGQILVRFDPEDNENDGGDEQVAEISMSDVASEEYAALERELQTAKANLQSTLEEAQTTNEELQAANEQLTASNEELQSTNEELHSVNEELYTVNAEHQRKIEELIELTDDMDNLLNSTNVHTLFLDSELTIRRFTPGIAAAFNLIPQDAGRRLDTFTYNIRYDGLARDVEKVIRGGVAIDREVEDKKSDWYFLRIQPYITRGQIDGAVLTLVDITSMKQAEARLAELSEIVEHSEDAIFRQDVEGKIRTWNRGAEKLFDQPSEATLGEHVSTLGLECERHSIHEILDLVRNGQSLEHVDAKTERSSGSIVDVALSVSPIRDANQNVIGASMIARDVTKQRRAEAEVREAVKRRDDFLAMLSHELRNPLAAVLNATSLLNQKGVDESGMDEARNVIEHNVQHIARILDDLLDVSRITSDKINMQHEIVDLCDLTLDVVGCIQHRVDAKHQELHMMQPEHPLFVEGDIGRLQQMQVNLLVNASKYTGDRGRIDYELSQSGNEVVIAVTDNGEGIPEDLVDSIFDPFVQAEQTIDRAAGGMGLGLTLVKKVAEAHCGNATVASDGPGKGSRFEIRLPLTDKRPNRRVKPEEIDTSGMRLVLVEDNEGVRNMLAKTMQLKGFEVKAVSSGREAITAFEEFNPSIAIIDIGLPDLNGYEVAREIRSRSEYQNVMLVALTGYGRDQDRQQALASGYDVHLVKPLDPDELLRSIASVGSHVAT